jgi:choice-of-anchor A domain-containing protein/LPXTG-motif cell wall-anchored protein
MYKQKKGIIFVVLVLLVNILTSGTVVAETFVPKDPGSIHDDLTGDYGLLGIASQFHVFTKNKTTVNAHTDGNIATRELDANQNFGTNLHEGYLNEEINYIQATDSFINSSGVPTSETRINKFVVGTNVAVSEEDGHPTVNGSRLDHLTFDDFYQDKPGNTYINFDEEFAKLNTAADTLTNLTPVKTFTSADFPDMNNRTIDLTGASDTGFVLVNIDAAVLSLNTPLNIINPNDQVVVFNVVNGGTDFTVQSPIKYNDRTNHETEDFSDANISWNFGNAMTNLTINAPFQGTILAPNATIDVRQSQDGTIIGTNVILDAATNRWDPNEIFPTPNVETLTISGEKIWKDDNNLAGERPDSITVELLQNGTIYQTQVVTPDENNSWLYTFNDLPKYDATGSEYSYAIAEETVPADYTVEVDGYNLINTYNGSDESSSSTDTTDTTDTSSTTDTTSTTDSTDTTDTTSTTDSTDSTDTTSTTDSTDSTDTTSTTDSTDTTDTTSTTDSTDTTDTTSTTESTDSTDTTSTTESTDSTDTTSTTESTDSTDTTSTTDSTDTTGSSSTTRATDTTGTTSTTETTDASTSDPTEPTSSTGEAVISGKGDSYDSGQQNQSTSSEADQKEGESTSEQYLLNTGSTSSKWLVATGLVLIAGVITIIIWRRKQA